MKIDSQHVFLQFRKKEKKKILPASLSNGILKIKDIRLTDRMLKYQILQKLYCRCFSEQRFMGEDAVLFVRTVAVAASAWPELQKWGERNIISKHFNLLPERSECQHLYAVPVPSSKLVS